MLSCMQTYALPIEVIRENVRRLMIERGMGDNESELSRKAKLVQRTLNKVLNTQDNPTLGTLTKIARGLDLSVWQLLMPNVPGDLAVTQPLMGGMDAGACAVASVYTCASEETKKEVRAILGYAAERDLAIRTRQPKLLEALRSIPA